MSPEHKHHSLIFIKVMLSPVTVVPHICSGCDVQNLYVKDHIPLVHLYSARLINRLPGRYLVG